MASLHTGTAGPLSQDDPGVSPGLPSGVTNVAQQTVLAVAQCRNRDKFRGNRRPSLRVTVLMSAQPRPLEGRKILIVEDEAPIALSLASAVAQAGGFAVGPAATVAASFALMADHALDGALLDIRLRGETSFPLADVLAVLGIPFVFVSGLSSALMPYTHRERLLFDKPYEAAEVIATLARLVKAA